MRLLSPPPSLSAPSTERLVLVPVTGEALAFAAEATVGAASLTVTAVAPLAPPLVAVTVAVPEA